MQFCAFLRFFCISVLFVPTKMGCKKAHICAECCKIVQKALLCNTPFSYTPFCASPTISKKSRDLEHLALGWDPGVTFESLYLFLGFCTVRSMSALQHKALRFSCGLPLGLPYIPRDVEPFGHGYACVSKLPESCSERILFRSS